MTEMRTINGKPLNVILEELSANIPEELIKRTYDGYAYFAIHVYQDRLNEVVGQANYNYSEDNLCTVTVNGVTAVNVRGTITLKYDDGTACIERTAYGSENVGVASESESGKAGKPNGLSNSVKAAATDAFVQCCRKLGIADKQLRDIRACDKDKGKRRGGSEMRRGSGQEYKLRLDGAIRAIGEKGFKASALLNGNERVNVKIWVNSDAYKQITSQMGNIQTFATKCKGIDITVIGVKGIYNGEAEIEVNSLVLKKSA